MKTLIVADDLSGAADCAVAFGGALVLMGETPGELDDAALAIDADTRAADPAQAAEQTRSLFARYGASRLLFKKFDSTLRGHVGIEIAAALKVLPGALAIVCPSFPATGRTMRGGRLHVNGVPLNQSEFRDEVKDGGDLVAMLKRAGLNAALAAPPDFATSANALVCDAETDADLDAIVAAGLALRRPILWAGAGGLARALARALKQDAPRLIPPKPVGGTILYLVGSRNAASREQAERFAAEPPVTLVRITEAMLRDSPPHIQAPDLVLMLDGEPHADPGALANAFAAWAAPLAAKADALFLTGGETAHAVLKTLGAHGLRLSGEIAPGVTFSTAEGGIAAARPVIVKAGAFGAPDTMRRCRDILRGHAAALR